MTNVVMPQMGESIAEGTIVRWIKKVGDSIDRDEPLFEISTDKVDAEIPSPAAGVLTEIKVKEGETVPVNSVVAIIGAAGEVVAPAAVAPRRSRPRPRTRRRPTRCRKRRWGNRRLRVRPPRLLPPPPAEETDLKASFEAGLKAIEAEATPAAPETAADAEPDTDVGEKDELRRQKSSPLVRRIARDNNVDIAQIHGTGLSGRVTKQDILGFIESGRAAPAGGTGRCRARAGTRAGSGPHATSRARRCRSSR